MAMVVVRSMKIAFSLRIKTKKLLAKDRKASRISLKLDFRTHDRPLMSNVQNMMFSRKSDFEDTITFRPRRMQG